MRDMSRRRVVVTGVGMVTSLGVGVERNWHGLLQGESGIGAITRFPADSLLVRIAGEVKDSGYSPDSGVCRHTHYALLALDEALESSGLKLRDPRRAAVCLGVGEGDYALHAEHIHPYLVDAFEGGGADVDWSRYLNTCLEARNGRLPKGAVPCVDRGGEARRAVSAAARRVGAAGPHRVTLTACAAGAQALADALRLIRIGKADVAVAGGSHSLVTIAGIMGFMLLQALSRRNDEPSRASRPFDAARDGFVLAEGAGILVLEEYEHARSRGADILAEFAGAGLSADAYRVTDPHPEGAGGECSMRRALEDAGLAPSDVTYVNAHGTSTKSNDRTEAMAIGRVFGPGKVPVTSNKSQWGHLIAAAGAVEAVASVLSIVHGAIPPTINYEEPDPECDVDVVAERRDERVRCVLSNSFGFGGQNVSLIFTGVR